MSYPRTVNGWELVDTDTVRYTKQTDEGHAFIDITWIDQTHEDPDYGTGREYVVCASVEEGEYEEAEAAFDEHHTDPFAISDVVERAEAERIVMEYMQEN